MRDLGNWIIVVIVLMICGLIVFGPRVAWTPQEICEKSCSGWGKTDYVCIEKCMEMKGAKYVP